MSSEMYLWTRKSPLNLKSNPESASWVRIRTWFALAKVCALRECSFIVRQIFRRMF